MENICVRVPKLTKSWLVVEYEVAEFYYAKVVEVTNCENLIRVLNSGNVIFASVFNTKKSATHVATEHNNGYIKNGNYLYAWRN